MSADLYDSLDHHLARQGKGDIAKASVPMGMLLGWAVNMHLVSEALVQANEQLVVRIRFQEASGRDLLIASGGDLRREMFNPNGMAFLDTYYSGYMDDYIRLFGETCYEIEDTVENYTVIAEHLTGQLMRLAGRSPVASTAMGGSGFLARMGRGRLGQMLSRLWR